MKKLYNYIKSLFKKKKILIDCEQLPSGTTIIYWDDGTTSVIKFPVNYNTEEDIMTKNDYPKPLYDIHGFK